MFGVFVGATTARAVVLYPSVPSCLVPVATVKVGYVPCYPALEGFWELAHYLADAIPVDIVEGRAEDLITSTE